MAFKVSPQFVEDDMSLQIWLPQGIRNFVLRLDNDGGAAAMRVMSTRVVPLLGGGNIVFFSAFAKFMLEPNRVRYLYSLEPDCVDFYNGRFERARSDTAADSRIHILSS